MSLNRSERVFWIGTGLLFVVVCAVFLLAPAWTQHPNVAPAEEMHDMSDMGDMPDMPEMQHSAVPETPEQLAKHLRDKRESEFNHRLAGALVILAALFFLAQGSLSKRWPGARYAWPDVF